MYTTYGEFLNDMRLVFSNAIKYNSAHLDDAASMQVYEAAKRLQAKLEDMMPRFTLDLAERAECDRISASREEKARQEEFDRQQLEKQKNEAYLEDEEARRAANDDALALDNDVLAKKAKTAAEEKEYLEQEKLKRHAAMEDAGVDLEYVVPDLAGGSKANKEVPLLRGYGSGDAVPTRLLPVWRAKRFCREQAWISWEPVSNKGQGGDGDRGEVGSNASLAVPVVRSRPWAPVVSSAVAVSCDLGGGEPLFVMKMDVV
jgi:hypothetical protein